jgi:hypothetical protein
MTVIGGKQRMQNRGASARRTNNKKRFENLFVSHPGVATNPVADLKPNFKQPKQETTRHPPTKKMQIRFGLQ